MSANCPAVPLHGPTPLSGTLLSLDCHIRANVETGYQRLFGSHGAFGLALTSLLTLFVAVLAFGLLTGRMRLTLPAIAPKVLALCLVLSFATSWPGYQVVVYNLMTGAPDEIAAAMSSTPHGAATTLAERMDTLLLRFGRMAKTLEDAQTEANTNANNVAAATQQAGQHPQAAAAPAPDDRKKLSPSDLVSNSGYILLLSTVGVLVLSRLMLALLLATGPVFICFALFDATRGLTAGWLRAVVAMAIVPMLGTLGGALAFELLGPVITAIARDPLAVLQDPQPAVTLFVGAIVYGALMALAAITTLYLTIGWRPLRGKETANASANGNTSTAPHTTIAHPAAQQTLGHPHMASPSSGFATASGLSSLTDARIQSLSIHAARPGDGVGSAPNRTALPRREGLSQRFKKPSAAPAPMLQSRPVKS